jgi:hypothetical protein
VRTSHSTTSRAPANPPPARIALIAPAPPSVVALPPTPRYTVCAPAAIVARISSPVPKVLAATASRSGLAIRSRPLAAAVSRIPV